MSHSGRRWTQVNAMAEGSDGFIWRLICEDSNATDVAANPTDPDFIPNMAVWRDVAALGTFPYRQVDHREILARRKEWFDPIEPSLAIWPVIAGHIPSVEERLTMLARLGNEGPSAHCSPSNGFVSSQRGMNFEHHSFVQRGIWPI